MTRCEGKDATMKGPAWLLSPQLNNYYIITCLFNRIFLQLSISPVRLAMWIELSLGHWMSISKAPCHIKLCYINWIFYLGNLSSHSVFTLLVFHHSSVNCRPYDIWRRNFTFLPITYHFAFHMVDTEETIFSLAWFYPFMLENKWNTEYILSCCYYYLYEK